MKLLLTSKGLKNRSIEKAFFKLVGKKAKDICIAYVPTALHAARTIDKRWFIDTIVKFKTLKIGAVDVADFSAVPRDMWLPKLKRADVIYVEGGNIYHLMYWINKSGLGKILPELLKNKVYVGASAGSMVLGTKLITRPVRVYSKYIPKFRGNKALGLVPFSIRPHFGRPDRSEFSENGLNKLAHDNHTNLYAVDDESAILIDDNKLKIVSEGKWLNIDPRISIISKIEQYMKTHVPRNRRPKQEYFNHVLGGRRYALNLATEYGSNKFIIESAILLHDIGADAGTVHAQMSVSIARPLLPKFGINKKDANFILDCIKTHSMGPKPKTLEQQIIQDADGLIFIEDTFKYFYKKRSLDSKDAISVTSQKTLGMMKKIRTKKGKILAKKLIEKSIKWIKDQK